MKAASIELDLGRQEKGTADLKKALKMPELGQLEARRGVRPPCEWLTVPANTRGVPGCL